MQAPNPSCRRNSSGLKQKIPNDGAATGPLIGELFVRMGLDLFLDLGALADSVSEVVQLCSADLTVADYIHGYDVGRVKREGLFHAAAICHTTNGEGFGDNAA